ncbi:MAG: large repetitive protein, partial [Gaiellales bacterium]|nr:large repetitive protein [Gaiellales bacterium]
MFRRPFIIVFALLASLAFAQAAAAQPITLDVTSARTVTNQPDPVELTGTISIPSPTFSGTGTLVTGSGTLFTSELQVGDRIRPYTAPGQVRAWLVVTSFLSDTSMRVSQPAINGPGGVPAPGGRYNGPAVSGVKFSKLPALVTVAKGDPVTTYKYLINQEDTDNNSQPASACHPTDPGNTDPTLSSCMWTSIRHLSGSSTAAPGDWNATNGYAGLVPDSSPVVTSGDQSDFANGATITLPPGKYLISFMADGHKIDGAHFTTDASATTKTIHGQAQPFNLPLATERIQVFNDNASTNGQWDEGDETYDAQANRAARMPGFTAHLADVLGEVTTDWYGNPLCTTYRPTTAPGRRGYELDAEGHPIILVKGGRCVSNLAGEITIPNLGPDRYATTVLAPNRTVVTPPGQQPTCRNKDWIKTTTLEGALDWDVWLQEGATGYDTEFLHSGEATPWMIAGFVCPRNEPSANASTVGTVTGRVLKARVYWPAQGGLPYNGTVWGGYAGTKTDGPIDRPWVSLAGLQQGDLATAVVQGDADGRFTIPRVPPGDYMISIWDAPLENLLDTFNLTVRAGQPTDIGDAMLTGWFTQIKGTIYHDLNENGRQDPGEVGIPGFPVAIKSRVNSIMDQGSAFTLTDFAGHYSLDTSYPLNLFNVLEAYDDRWMTTGVTYQADNQPTPTTMLGAGVDVSFLPVIGLSGRLDWGVKPYLPGENGGIVGTVLYDTTRNELDPAQSATEDYEGGIPGLQVDLFKPVACTNATPAASCSTEGYVLAADGSYELGDWINRYQTESWQQPKSCIARGVDSTPLVGEQVLPRTTDPLGNPVRCLEGPLMGVQFGGDDPFNSPNPDANYFSSVDGNYGFGDGWTTPGGRLGDGSPDPANPGSGSAPLAIGDYLVKVEVPNDPLHPDRKLYTPTREEDINVFSGDVFQPSAPPPPCAGALHTVHVTSADFLDAGGSPYEGQARPLCDTKLVPVRDAKSIAPSFSFFTDVPVPGKFWGLVNDDLNVSVDPKSILFGEKAGIGNAPVGIYDFTDRLVDTQHTDPNGFFTSLLPSTSTYNCPLPAGPCPNMYRVVGNDPGQPGARNLDYHPEYSTISANFQVWPGLMLPVDTAPIQTGVSIKAPGSSVVTPVECRIAGTTPQLYAVSAPYGNANDQIVVRGLHFGATEGTVQLDGTTAVDPSAVTGWSDTSFTLTIPATTTPGQHRLAIINTAAAPNAQSLNGIALHVLGNGYRPSVIEVGPDMWTILGSPASLRFRLGTAGAQTGVIPAPFSAAQIQTAISGLPGLA